MSKLLTVNNLSKKFNTIDGEIEAIKDISLDVNDGEFIAIVGPSGCGKSTLLSIIAGLEKESSGELLYSIKKPVIGYMLQEDALFEHMKIKDNILLGLKIQKKLTDENIKYTMDLLQKYNLYDFKDKRPSELSGGMKQRVALICVALYALAIEPTLIEQYPNCELIINPNEAIEGRSGALAAVAEMFDTNSPLRTLAAALAEPNYSIASLNELLQQCIAQTSHDAKKEQ